MTVRLSGALMATAALAIAGPAAASADVSSLDAYAGQAAVLGKPHHHKHHHRGGFSAVTRGGRSANGHGSAIASGGKPAGSAATHSNSTTGSSGSESARNGTGGSAGSGTGNRGSSTPGSTQGGESSLARGVRNAVPASSSSSLTSVDVAVLCAIALMLVSTGLLIRRLSRQPR